MNASDLSRLREGAIFNTHNSASSIAVMGKTSRFFGSIAMTSSNKKRTFAAKKCGALLSLCFVGRNPSGAILANLLPCFWRTDVATKFLKQVAMSFLQMFFLREAFKVFCSVVRFIAIDVMHLFIFAKRGKPTFGNDAVEQTPAASNVSIFSDAWAIRLQLSDNFSTARNGVKMVKKSVFDFFYRDANHVVPSLVVMESSF